jgi:hypothetical protein
MLDEEHPDILVDGVAVPDKGKGAAFFLVPCFFNSQSGSWLSGSFFKPSSHKFTVEKLPGKTNDAREALGRLNKTMQFGSEFFLSRFLSQSRLGLSQRRQQKRGFKGLWNDRERAKRSSHR